MGAPIVGSWAAGVISLALVAAAAPQAPPAEADPKLAAQKRMHAELARIRDRADAEHAFLGAAPKRAVLAAYQALPATATPHERWRLARELGAHQLRLGEFEDAVRTTLVAREQLEHLRGKITELDARATFNAVGIAYLRLGETQNCVARHTSQSCILPIGPEGVHQEDAAARHAIDAFLTTLRWFPDDLVARWLLNLANMAVGEWPDKVPERWRIAPEVFASQQPFPRFLDVAPDLGINTFDLSGGSVIDDFDGDELLDIVTSTWDTRGSMTYRRNAGDGTFVERTEEAGLAPELGGINAIQGDYDNDGDLDLFVLRGAWLRKGGHHPNSLLENDGHGRFTDVTYHVGLAEPFYPTHSAAFGDYDLDGDLDLYVGNESEPEDPNPSQLFRNDGGRFVNVAVAAGVTNLRYAKGVSWGDCDGDRDPDLYVSNLFEENRLYLNRGDGTFQDVARERKVHLPEASFPVWWWDYDNDGALDIYVSSWERDVTKYVASLLELPVKGEHCRLYRGDGRGGFEDVATKLGLARLDQPMGANFGDLDGDGWLDFYLGTGYPEYEALMPKAMYRNVGGKGFVDVTTAGGFGHLQKGHGVSFVDIDHDGDVDVHEQMGGAFPGDAFGNVLYENPGFGNRWLKVRLVGREENRSAIGARICVTFREGETTRKLYRHVNSGGSFGSNPLRQDLGLGAATAIQSLEILWPRSGKTQTFTAVPLDACLRITEGEPAFERIELRPMKLGGE